MAGGDGTVGSAALLLFLNSARQNRHTCVSYSIIVEVLVLDATSVQS